MSKQTVNIPDWVKDLDLGRAAENLLMGAVLFVARFIKTHCHVLVRPKLIHDEVLTITEYKDALKLSYVRPLLFFALSGFIAIAFSQKSLGGISFVEEIFDHYPFLSSSIDTKIKDFSLIKSMALMIPLIFVVALYAKITQKCFKLLGVESPFRPHLSICAYVCGSLFMAESIASNFEMHFWGGAGAEGIIASYVQPAFGLAGMFSGALIGILVILRYFQYLKLSFDLTWVKSIYFGTLSAIGFWVVFTVIVISIDPFLISLK
ncbi:hypothetical protein F0266_01755 [Vibrio coralliilyticus]|uniref:hypothetical protein n=1 Tax=Vibrio coralliilyticus TaxID=190893 RepID=UPI00148BAF32|nr:hypothetical protein [Vibrio coralliilyticus]NOH51644.1 hypothetical protein [Vibrio coralliilyticus]